MSYSITISIPDEWLKKILKKEGIGLDSGKIREYVLKIIEKEIKGE